MLHWICPDCGNDCSPTVRECPACADAPLREAPPSKEAVTEGMVALARSHPPAMDIRLLAPAPQQLLLAAVNGNGNSNGKMPAFPLQEDDVKIPEDETLESLVRPLVESAGATPVVEADADAGSLIEACVEAVAMAMEVAVEAAESVQVEAVPARVEEVPAVETAQAPPVVEAVAGAGEELAAGALVQAAGVPAPGEEVPAVATAQGPREVEAVASAVEELAPVAVEQVAVVPARVEEVPAVAIPEPAPVVESPVEAIPAMPEEAPGVASPLPEPTYDPGPLCHALELHAEAVLHVIHTELEAFQSRIRAIVATFEVRACTALLAAPREIIKAPAPPATQWLRTPKPSIPSVKPCDP